MILAVTHVQDSIREARVSAFFIDSKDLSRTTRTVVEFMLHEPDNMFNEDITMEGCVQEVKSVPKLQLPLDVQGAIVIREWVGES